MAQTLQSWAAQHPGVEIDGAGRWLVWKPCRNKARRFGSYFAAHTVSNSFENCQCGGSHFIVELEGPPAKSLTRSWKAMVEAE